MAEARFEWDPIKDRENQLKHGVGFAVACSPSVSLIGEAPFASLARDIGGRVNNSMSAKIRYTDEPLGKPKVVPDFLPAPEDLIFRDEGVKVTLALSKRSVDFFKREAARHNTQYQRMIRRLLDAYAAHHTQPPTSRSTRPRLRRAG